MYSYDKIEDEQAEHRNYIYTNEMIKASDIELANIQLTEAQLIALNNCAKAFKGFAEVMIKVMHANTVGIADMAVDLIKALQQPEKDFTQKHKPWKKDRFYY